MSLTFAEKHLLKNLILSKLEHLVGTHFATKFSFANKSAYMASASTA